MTVSASELREKDVINICDGRRIGCVCDFSLDADSGKICAVYVSDSFFGFADRKSCVKIEWCRIKCIGEDTVLVDIGCETCRPSEEKCRGEKKRGFFFC